MEQCTQLFRPAFCKHRLRLCNVLEVLQELHLIFGCKFILYISSSLKNLTPTQKKIALSYNVCHYNKRTSDEVLGRQQWANWIFTYFVIITNLSNEQIQLLPICNSNCNYCVPSRRPLSIINNERSTLNPMLVINSLIMTGDRYLFFFNQLFHKHTTIAACFPQFLLCPQIANLWQRRNHRQRSYL